MDTNKYISKLKRILYYHSPVRDMSFVEINKEQ